MPEEKDNNNNSNNNNEKVEELSFKNVKDTYSRIG